MHSTRFFRTAALAAATCILAACQSNPSQPPGHPSAAAMPSVVGTMLGAEVMPAAGTAREILSPLVAGGAQLVVRRRGNAGTPAAEDLVTEQVPDAGDTVGARIVLYTVPQYDVPELTGKQMLLHFMVHHAIPKGWNVRVSDMAGSTNPADFKNPTFIQMFYYAANSLIDPKMTKVARGGEITVIITEDPVDTAHK